MQCSRWKVVVPILFLEFLVISLPAGVMPIVVNEHFGKRAYFLSGLALTIKGFLAFLTSPALGSLSDVYGRKFIFLATVVGTSGPSAVLGLGASLETHLVLVAASGMFAATFPLAFAFIADNVPPADRSSAFGTAIGIGLGGAYLFGPPAGASLNEAFGSALVFRACTVITVLNTVFVLVALRDRRRPAAARLISRSELLRRANPFAAFGMLRANGSMRLLAAVTLFFYVALWGFLANKGVYARRRFQMTAPQTAAQLAIFGLVSTVSQSVGLGFARRFLSDAQIARRCYACAVASQLVYAFAADAQILYVAMALLGVSVGGFATTSALASQVVPHHLVGEAQGVLNSVKALMEGVGPLAFAWMMPRFEDTWLPGAPWLLSAVLMAAAFALCLRLEDETDDAVRLHRHSHATERCPSDRDSVSEDSTDDDRTAWDSHLLGATGSPGRSKPSCSPPTPSPLIPAAELLAAHAAADDDDASRLPVRC